METEVVKLTGRSVFEVVEISRGHKYQTGQRADDGETYRRYRYNGTVFTIPENDRFNKLFDNGKISMIKLIKSERNTIIENEDGEVIEAKVPSIQFDSYMSNSQELNVVKHETQLKRIEIIATSDLSDEKVEALLSAEPV